MFFFIIFQFIETHELLGENLLKQKIYKFGLAYILTDWLMTYLATSRVIEKNII